MESIHEIVREAEQNFTTGTVKIGKYVDWSLHDTIERIDAYLNSKHISGEKDSAGREKPFFNIVTAAVNIWYRATDIDRKDIRIMPDSAEHTAIAFIANVHLQNWMKSSRFATFLNDWGRALARYGSAVVKFVEKDGELVASVIPWNRMIVDSVDFDALPRIEKFYLTPAQLRKKEGYDQGVVNDLIETASARKTLDDEQVDQQNHFIELYEVHGMLPSYMLDDEPKPIEDEDAKFVQQMHVISYVQGQDGKYHDFCLYKGREKKDPYMITHLIREDGRTLSIGAVEYLFNAQWMTNHSVKNMKDTLDISSKLIFQTSDAHYVGRNVLSSIESGQIMIHKVNEPLTQVNNSKPDIQAFQNFGQMWQSLAQEITSTPEALRGTTLPSGTPYSLGAYLGQNANSLFEIMTENKGNHIEDMMREYIIPHLMTKMDTKDEIVATLDAQGISEIDAMYIPREAVRRYNKRAVDTILEGGIPSPFQPEMEQQSVRDDMAPLGNKRFFKPDEVGEKTWKQAQEGFAMTATVEVTNENTDKQAVLTTLSSVFQTIASNPAILQDQNAKMIFGAILSETGRISPIQLSTASATRTPQVAPTGGAEQLSALTNQPKQT